MTTTIKDIAKRLDISHSTVSRALNGSSLIADSTAKRIRQTAEEMGYMHSAAARSLKTNRTQALGVIVSQVDDPFFGEILRGIEEVAQNNEYSIFMAASQHDPEKERRIVQSMREHRVDGVIICSASLSQAQSKQFTKYGIPIVVVNNQSAEDYRYSIYHDDVDGSRQVTRYLIGLGHQRIAYLGNSASGRTNWERISGFQQEMAVSNLAVPAEYIFGVPGGGPENGVKGVAYFLALEPRPTAIVCFNDMIAAGVLRGLQDAGISVPGQMSVTGFDNIVFSEFTSPPLTTLDQPKRFIGSEAAHLVLKLLDVKFQEETNQEPIVQILKGKLLIRQSCAPVNNLP
ncbi:MAG: LacI family DNA-binding transcriptional regulator [Anaerolineaceae bacterium]